MFVDYLRINAAVSLRLSHGPSTVVVCLSRGTGGRGEMFRIVAAMARRKKESRASMLT